MFYIGFLGFLAGGLDFQEVGQAGFRCLRRWPTSWKSMVFQTRTQKPADFFLGFKGWLEAWISRRWAMKDFAVCAGGPPPGNPKIHSFNTKTNPLVFLGFKALLETWISRRWAMQDFVVRPGSLPPVNSWISQETLGVHMFYTVFSRFLLGRPGFPGGGP